MRIFKTKTFFIILTIATVVWSCGRVQEGGGSAPSLLGQTILTETILNNAEEGIALRICYAYQTKRSKFRSDFIGDNFIFDLRNRDCIGNDRTESFSATLQSHSVNSNMHFSGTTSLQFFSDVDTDINGELKDICSKLFRNDDVNNTVTRGNEKVQYQFFLSFLDIQCSINFLI